MKDADVVFSELYELNKRKFYKIAYRIVGNASDAEDILQEAFINAFTSFNKFEGRSTFESWMYRILINCAYKHINKQKKLPIESVANGQSLTEDEFFHRLTLGDVVADAVLTNDIRENCLQMFLNCMPKKQRIAFTLKVIADFSVKETALIMGISESAVKINVFRARQHMKDNMEGRCSLINPNNPCRCELWAKYIQSGGMPAPVVSASTVREKRKLVELDKEMLFLNKLKLLYDQDPIQAAKDIDFSGLKKIIEQKRLKLLS